MDGIKVISKLLKSPNGRVGCYAMACLWNYGERREERIALVEVIKINNNNKNNKYY